jgi:hypothetical protein
MQPLRLFLFITGLLVLSSPARSVVIDDFSVGQFNIQATGGISEGSSSQNCLSFCLAVARVVHLEASDPGAIATAQLVAPPGAVQMVAPVGGAILAFNYTLFGGASKNLTEAGTATQLEVWFTAFEPGASVFVGLTDINDVSESHTINPSFATSPTQLLPGIAAMPLSSFVTVDLTQIKYVLVSVHTQSEAGVYEVTLITVPGSKAVTKTTFGESETVGPPYPTFPKIALQWETLPTLGPVIDVTLALDDVQDESGLQVGASVEAVPDGTASFLATTFESPADNPTIAYTFDFIPVQIMPVIPVQIMPVSWGAGQNFAEVIANLPVDGGTWQWRLFIETNQPVNLAGVTAVPGSALVTVDIAGSVDVGSPVLKMAMAGDFTPTPAVPALNTPWAEAMLAFALLAMGVWMYGAKPSPQVGGSV